VCISRSQDKQICRLRYLETKTPGCDQISVRAGEIKRFSYKLGISIPALLFKNYNNESYLNPLFKLQCKKKGYLSVRDDQADNKQTNAVFSARVFYHGDWS